MEKLLVPFSHVPFFFLDEKVSVAFKTSRHSFAIMEKNQMVYGRSLRFAGIDLHTHTVEAVVLYRAAIRLWDG